MMPSQESLRIGVYVDVANISMNGGYGMQYDVLREFACRGGAVPLRLNAYVGYDVDRAKEDLSYRHAQHTFHEMMREQGFKVIEKPVKWYVDDRGTRVGKANADLNLAVDALLQSDILNRVLLVTGDGDFTQVVNALQNKGCRIEVVAFDNVSAELRREADMFLSGYLIPGLLPIPSGAASSWGQVGSRVRGTCYYFNAAKGFGFFRFMKHIAADLWNVDTRKPGSPYLAVFFHFSQLPAGYTFEILPSRDLVFEFDLERSTRPQADDDAESLQAARIQVVGIRP
jgi:hypothetical protein